jgi:4-amino-4-deoxy-L-arabinose transferase-like glycosyltransferase
VSTRRDPLTRRAGPGERLRSILADARLHTAMMLAVIVAVGAALRIWALGGLSFALGSDDSRYVAVAQNLAAGSLPQGDAEWFGARAVFLWPVALIFRLAGADDYRAVAWPLACSLLSIVAAFLIGRELVGRRPGLVAAGLVALAPIEIIWATRLRPDAVMPAFVALAVWAALRSRRSTGRAGWWLAGAGVLSGAAWSAREAAIVMVPVVVLAAWPSIRASWRRVAAYAGGLVAIPLAEVVVFAFDGRPLWPLTATAGAGSYRSPLAGLERTTSYISQLVTQVGDPRSPLFLVLPVVLIAGSVALARGLRAAALPAAWLAWGALYLEIATLASVDKPARFLTLLTVPAALLIAIALDGRCSPLLLAGLAVITVVVMQPRVQAGHRGTNVVLLSAVTARMRDLPRAPVLSADYTWWAKLNAFLPQGRLPVPRVVDPAYLDGAQRAEARRLTPLPDPRDYRGGYVVTGPVREVPGWPDNWSTARARIATGVPRDQLTPVARVGRATIWRWDG